MHDTVVLGLDFGGSKIAVAVADPTGRRLASTVVQTSPSDGAQYNFTRGVVAARQLLAGVELADPQRPNHSTDAPEVIAVGACTFGIPGPYGVKLAPAIPGWAELALADELQAAFPGAAIRLATDVKAAAYAEATDGALVGCNPGMYLNLGTGLALAVVVDGKVVSGRDGAAGEIGYYLRTPADVGLPESKRTILEDAVSGMALRRLASSSSGRPTGAAELFATASHDPAAAALIFDFASELAYHVVNLAIAINPARIVVGGGMTGAWEQVRPRLRHALDVAVPFPPELTLARFPFDAPLRGALALGLAAGWRSPDPAIP